MLRRKHLRRFALASLFLLSTGAGGESTAHVLAALAIVLVLAKVVGELFERMGQPAVLGEILAGVLLGNLPLVGFHGLEFVLQDSTIEVLAEIGVVFLLFEVGLESNVTQMLRVGASSFLVATVGVVTPMALGYFVAQLLLPTLTWHAHLFLGAILTATSVGITARVLRDLGRLDSIEGRIVLGAAVIDDVLGLVVLAVVQGIVLSAATPGAGLGVGGVVWIVVKALLFLGGAIALGPLVSRHLFRAATVLRIRGVLLALAIAFCFALSYAAAALDLAFIVGAFAAGLVLDEVNYQELRGREAHGLEEQIRPIAAFLVPVFFVRTGGQVDLRVFTSSEVVVLAAALTAAAIVGKQVCGLAVLDKGLDRLSIGIGMIPRGEVGLIFADKGANLLLPTGVAVVDARAYGATIVMVLVTTLLTPPALAWSLRRKLSARR